METRKIIYLLAFAIAVLAIFFGCSCDREEPDVVPPSVPSGLNSTSTTNSINLSWSPSSDNVGVVGYKIYRDAIVIGNATSTSFTDKNLMPNSSYVYTVVSLDAAQNVSKQSSPHTAKTIDDCPTCSKWMTEVNLIAPSIGIINSGEAKSAGSLIVKNTSTSSHIADFTLTFAGAGASAVDSLNYTIGGQTTKQKLENNSVTLNQVSVPANSSTEIKLVYRIKETLPAGIVDQSQITLLLTATTTDEAGITQPRNGIFPSMNLDKLKVYTAKIDAANSYEASAVAEDKILFGNSVAKAFVLEVTTPGTVRLEVVGKMTNGSSPIKYFWVNSKDDVDFNVSVSTLSPIIPKTTLEDKTFVEVNLKAGTNVIAFKTNPYSAKIANNAKVGLKVTGSGFSMTNESYIANSAVANLAGKIKVLARVNVGFYLPPEMPVYDFYWCQYFIYPQNEDGSYNDNAYPKIVGVGISTEYYAKNYPKVFFAPSSETPPEFTENFVILGADFGENVDPERSYYGTVFAKDLANNTVKYENNIISFSGQPQQTINIDSYAVIAIMLNAYNADTDYFAPGYVTFDPARTGWKFVGNPELELWTEGEVKTSVRIL